MKKRTQRLVALALSAMMVFGMVGCGNETPVTNTESQTTKETENKQTNVATESKVEEVVVSYPIETKETFTIFTNIGLLNNAYVSYTESPFFQGLAERTGIDAEWQFPTPGSEATQAYNLMLTEKKLPDIIFTNQVNNAASGYKALLQDDLIWDLTDYLPTYAPDLWAVLNQPEYEYVLEGLKTEDGRIGFVPSFVEGDYNITYMGPVVRKDWLDECGLDIPVTLEDWEDMLTKFKEKYGAGYATAKSYFASSYGLQSGTGAFGGLMGRWFLDNGEVKYSAIQPEWKEYVTIMNRWYENGLIDPDSVSMDNATLRAKAIKNEVGATFVPMSQLTNLINDAAAENTGAEWIGVGYPRTEAGAPTTWIQSQAKNSTGVGAAITKSCSEEKMIVALQYLNYGFTEEGMNYWNFGVEGETYTVDSEGNIAWTELITKDEQGTGTALSKYTGVSSSGITIQTSAFVKAKNHPVAGEAVYTWIENSTAREYYVPSLTMTEEETTAYADTYSAIASYVAEMALKFATGEESLDNFNAFLEKLDEMELPKCIEIQNAAYDRIAGK